MRTIKVKELTKENFAEYGSFYSITNPTGNVMGAFYPDPLIYPVSGNVPIAFSSLEVYKPEKMIVRQAEFHDTTGEGIVAIEDDVIIHVAPPSTVPTPEKTEAFLVPKGTVVKLNLGVWHLAPYAANMEKAHVMIILPQRIYKTDCAVIDYPEEDWFEIVK